MNAFIKISQTCEGPITESELLNALKSALNNKSPGKNDLTKYFYETFWEEIKISLCDHEIISKWRAKL